MSDDIGAAGDAPPCVSAAGGVAAPIPGTRAQPWTDADKVIFRHLWLNPEFTRAEVAARMGRSINACENHAGRIQLQRSQRPKAVEAARPGPVPATNTSGRAAAEMQAEAIRAYWAARNRPVTVTVIYVPGTSAYNGCWSARIVDTLAVPIKPAPGGTR